MSEPANNQDQTTHATDRHGARPPIIGIAGGIGSGKSAVSTILGDLGCLISDADEVVRSILLHDESVRRTLVEWWGDGVLDAEGRPSRPAIAAIVFKDETALRRLEQLLHPLVHQQRIAEWDRALAKADAEDRVIPALVIDAPLLFEAGLADLVDVVIFIDSDPEQRLARVKTGRGWDDEELKRRENAQWDLERKRDQSDYVLENNGSTIKLREKVERVLTTIIQENLPAST